MNKPTSLTSGLVAKKGQAAPAVAPKAAPSQAAATDKNYKALTVKLDRARYEALKTAGLRLDRKSQDIFVEALDLWLKANR